MREFVAIEVDIDAPIERVWQLMTDFEGYEAWNPFIRHASCTHPGPGGQLVLDVEFEDGMKRRSGQNIVRWDVPAGGEANLTYQFTGWLPRLRLISAQRVQGLVSVGNGRCRYTTREQFWGLLVWAMPLEKVRTGIRSHALALKSAAEHQAQGVARTGA